MRILSTSSMMPETSREMGNPIKKKHNGIIQMVTAAKPKQVTLEQVTYPPPHKWRY